MLFIVFVKLDNLLFFSIDIWEEKFLLEVIFFISLFNCKIWEINNFFIIVIIII